MVLLFLPGGHLRFAPAVDNVHVLCPQAHGAAGAVHGHVAAAHHGHSLAPDDGRVGLLGVGLHQVGPGQVLVGGVDALEGLSGDVHKHGKTGAGAYEYGLVAHFKQLVDGQDPADDHVGHDLHALGLQLFDLVGHNGLGQTEFRNAIYQHATGGVQRLEYGNGVALLGKVRGAGETGRTGAHHGDLYAVGRGLLWHGVHMLPVPVRHKPLQAANGHGFALDAPNALAFALALLGADPAGQGGQGVGRGDDFVGGLEVALSDLGDEFGNAHVDGAALHALGLLAAQAAAGLFHGLLGGVAQGHLFKVPGADLGVLLRHGGFSQSHICHCSFLLLKSGPCPWLPCGRRALWRLGPPGPGRHCSGS
ncbi:unknown [Firmicutes bacterium CAG:137]|nr:unknown [Firmicutes bacterium CAG:137]